jgi:hypothetical protein
VVKAAMGQIKDGVRPSAGRNNGFEQNELISARQQLCSSAARQLDNSNSLATWQLGFLYIGSLATWNLGSLVAWQIGSASD